MGKCLNCGKTISIWKIDLTDPLCPECKKLANEDKKLTEERKKLAEAEDLRNSFPCLIPDRPLTQIEHLGVGGATLGAGRSPWRDARIVLRDGRLHLEAIDTYKNKVELGEAAFTAGESITLEPISTGDQIKVVIGRAIILGLGIGFTIAVGIIVITRELKSLPYAVGIGGVGGLIVGMISCLAVLFKVQSGLMTASLETEDGYLDFLLKPDQIAEARRVLGLAKLTLRNPDSTGQGVESPEATPVSASLRKDEMEAGPAPKQTTKVRANTEKPDSSPFRITCPNCGCSLKARLALIGKMAKCPACKTPISIQPPKV
ncbi:MAG: hypothetical protein JW720_15835 [Sedimentisphaerales bacterium]|nr:hypothetical protein [Sedimentisphaerales bacterium]